MTSIEIPNSVTTLGDFVFEKCTKLTSVTFAEGSVLESVGAGAFEQCTSLTSIDVPNSVQNIGSNAFYACSNLSNVSFGENSELTAIGSGAFEDCSSLQTIVFDGSEDEWNAISFGDDWDYGTGAYTVVFTR